MGLLDGKHALVTGGSRGIGRAIALKFASEGADVAITFFSRKEEADAVVAEICAMGRRAVCYQSDASDFDAAGETVAAADAFLGGLDILVNNAGVTRDSLLIRMDEQQWDTVINANLADAAGELHMGGEGIQLLPSRRSPYDAPQERFHNQHLLGSGPWRQCRPVQLCGLEGRRDRTDNVSCQGTRSQGSARQLHRARLHTH